MSKNQKKRPLLGIFTVILFDIIGFGMLIPLTPILAREFGADGFKIGLLISAYSMIQFLIAPFWGRLSDVFGRKPILLVGFLGSSLAHLIFAFSDTFTEIFLSRLLAGFFGANIVIATAYIADLTSIESRSKNIGLIGMAFGLGFTIGPILGFLFILFGRQLGSLPPFGENFASMGSSIFCLINFVMSFFFLKESLKTAKPKKSLLSSPFKPSTLFRRPSIYMVLESFKKPKLGPVLVMSFILWFALAQIEPILILLVQDDFGWSKTSAYGSFIYIGLLMVLSQAYLVRKWIPQWGERLVNQRALFVMSLGLIAISISSLLTLPLAYSSLALLVLFIGVTFFSIGYSLSNTSLNGALSLLTSEKKQGSIFGVNQSLSSVARIVGPAMGGWFYQRLSHSSSFFIAGLLALFAFLISLWFKKDFPNRGKVLKQEKKDFQVFKKEDSSIDFHSSKDLEYALNKYQLKNLLERNVHFGFFQLEDPSLDYGAELKFLLAKASKIKEEELFSKLDAQNLEQPLVLVCNQGLISSRMAKKLQDKGFINAYFIQGGVKGLLEDKT